MAIEIVDFPMKNGETNKKQLKMAIYSGFSHEKWVDLSMAKCKRSPEGTVFIVSSCPCASLGLFICTPRAKTRRCFSMATGRHVLVAVAKIQRQHAPMGSP